MMIDLNDDHDLEVHIQELRSLDNYRKKSARLRDDGYQALKQWNQELKEWKEEESFNNEESFNKVLEHFSVKRPEDINIPTLDRLFYPDYGLCKALKKIKNKNNSISKILHRMRLHITILLVKIC